jgi:hypothetical protein
VNQAWQQTAISQRLNFRDKPISTIAISARPAARDRTPRHHFAAPAARGWAPTPRMRRRSVRGQKLPDLLQRTGHPSQPEAGTAVDLEHRIFQSRRWQIISLRLDI